MALIRVRSDVNIESGGGEDGEEVAGSCKRAEMRTFLPKYCWCFTSGGTKK